ncbi:hypothetical protein BTZ53_10730 [Vibrio parahaemolyticus]|uniref:hypothetical protein n=1 Tax=Vibrio parahaemolyticus TaxID=670 RepID=UPI000A38AF7A|nr:hypothetical protein [Vibrio parahaemolyticus]OUJ46284.1 hypothetical protein BTZ53_10730 [Vibrio parahaemolyticus]
MAQIIITIEQGSELGAVFTPIGVMVPIGTAIEVNGSEGEELALLVAHKLASTYHATLDEGVKAAIDSIINGDNRNGE